MTNSFHGIDKSQAPKKLFPKRVLFIADSKATHIIHWAKLLVQRGAQVAYFSFDPMDSNKFECYFFRPWLKSNYAKFIVNAPRVRKIIKQFKADIVHGYYLTNYGLLATLANTKHLVITVAGSDIFKEPTKSKFFYYSNKYVLQKADVVHSVAEHMTESLLKYNISKEKIITFPEGIDLKRFSPFKDDIINRASIIVSTRNFWPIYSIKTLIFAIPKVIKRHPSARFILIGDGEERSELLSLVHRLNVERYTLFLGYSTWETIATNLHKATIYVSTSLSDGTSASLLQAMVCGTFPILSNIAANREWVENGQNGALFPVGNSDELANTILQILENPHFRIKSAYKNRDKILDRASDQKMIDKLIVAYKNLLA